MSLALRVLAAMVASLIAGGVVLLCVGDTPPAYFAGVTMCVVASLVTVTILVMIIMTSLADR